MSRDHEQELLVYWKRNVQLILGLLAIWAFISLGCSILFVEWLNQFQFFGAPLGFWIAQQGSIYVFVALIFVYAWAMDRIDRAYHADE